MLGSSDGRELVDLFDRLVLDLAPDLGARLHFRECSAVVAQSATFARRILIPSAV